MPVNGGTRMLRARRKDINVKPNRRLDRKSSRGMLFENEELRMRTITINAEVEQGQHALKKLRKENEQLRREMWSLRDEYDKMEKLLRKKETDEDSDRENSYSDDNYSQTDSDQDGEWKKDEDAEREADVDSARAAVKFGNLTTARAFDGLSVIDEQTEETTTQTTESANGRSNSANRTLNQIDPETIRMFEDSSSCGESKPFFGSAYHQKSNQRKKTFAVLEGDPTFPACAADWPDNGYTVRPASPYPHAESFQPCYRRRFEFLQNLSPLVTRLPASAADESGWTIPGPAAGYGNPENCADDHFLRDKSESNPAPIQMARDFDYVVIRDRSGPDVFISDVCAKKNAPETGACGAKGATPPPEGLITDDGIIKNVETEIDRIEIGESNARKEQRKAREESPAAKLKTAKRVEKRDHDRQGPVQESVACQNPGDKDFREATLDGEDMPRTDKASLFQSKLMVTLKTPGTSKRFPAAQIPQAYQTAGDPYPECRYTAAASCRIANGFADERLLSPPLTENAVLNVQDIPLQLLQEGPAAPAETEAASHVGVAPSKPVKIPPAPPPRTSSCLGAIIPETPVGVSIVHRQTRGKAKNTMADRGETHETLEYFPDPTMHNPFLMREEPLATSSPVVSPRVFHRGQNLSLDNLARRCVYGTTNEESSTEDIPAKKTSGRPMDKPHLNKSVSSPSFDTFLRRKASERSVSSTENGTGQSHHFPRGIAQNNASMSSSSGMDSPIKCERRKRRVSIKFNKKVHPENGEERNQDTRRSISAIGVSGIKCGGRLRSKNRNEETDATTSERERTNSVSSRASSGRRKLSTSSNRTYLNDEKIPWCGCWGNGCV